MVILSATFFVLWVKIVAEIVVLFAQFCICTIATVHFHISTLVTRLYDILKIFVWH